MTRINVYSHGSELEGWFDADKATRWSDADVNGDGSRGTGRGEAICRTAGGRWVLECWSNWQNEASFARYVSDDHARSWLLRNHEDEAVAKYFGPIEDERGPGRPEIGGAIHVRLGDDLLGQLDAYASEHSQSRAEAARVLLGEALAAARPYAISFRDISTGLRETDTGARFHTLGAAVEALRSWEADDYERQQQRGLPSIQPRIEKDGRPVDVEAFAD